MKTGITLTAHDLREWSRFAQDAYANNRNDIGHRFSVASACHSAGQMIDCARFDYLQNQYRDWLCFNIYPEA
jgi:hypothetical protein